MPRKSVKSEAAALSLPETEPTPAPPPVKAKPAAKPRAKKVAAAPVLVATPTVAVAISTEPSDAQVAEEAYLLWLSEGQPAGRDIEHWLLAQQIVRSRLSLLSAAVHSA
ncbi:DUF2934 domain-containing protein [Niveispirillum sp. KHB5.9]|uniref:DUF2934 domain-containing protein n=1 Tax=Niveispirillum sp. KHB5.9 TaxID=3400269 RepID=UPI003A852102